MGGHRLRWIDTPHVPHGWEGGVLYDETTRTLLCGDLFTQIGPYPPTTSDDINGPANDAEDAFQAVFLVLAVALLLILKQEEHKPVEPPASQPAHWASLVGEIVGAFAAGAIGSPRRRHS